MSKIIIERISEWNNKRREIGIYINDKKAVTLKNGKTQEYELETGKHEVYAKIDWCRSQKINLDINENSEVLLKLKGFKFSSYILPAALVLMVLYYITAPIFEIKMIHIVWMPMVALLYPIYFITFGKNRYLVLTK